VRSTAGETALAPDPDGRVAFVTGGARGIGRAVAHTLAGAGADVMIGDLDAQEAEATADALRSTGAGRRPSRST
jgi:NAD(P)-dependent dehydrogenase (short-subunit alcohol dehydrogenase family)